MINENKTKIYSRTHYSRSHIYESDLTNKTTRTKIMNKTEFKNFCDTNNLTYDCAGRDWDEALVREKYVCAVINDAEDFEKIKSLLGTENFSLALAEKKDGQDWFKYDGYRNIYGRDAYYVSREAADYFAHFLSNKSNVIWYSREDIELRAKWLTDNRALDGEDTIDHFLRIEKIVEGDTDGPGYLAPLDVTEPGYWDFDNADLLLSERQMENGIWHYRVDNFVMQVVLAFKCEINEEACHESS